MNQQGRMLLRIVVGLYLLYLAYKLITAQMAGGTDMSDLVAYGAGAVLGLGGLGFCDYAVMSYFRAKKKEEASAQQQDG